MAAVAEAIVRWTAEGCQRHDDREVSITAALLTLLREVVTEDGLDVVIDPEHVEWDEAILSGERDPMTAPRFDLSFRSFGQTPWQFTIECKRLGRGATARDYVEEGLLEFADGRYAAADSWGGMLGYVVSGTPPQWHPRVNNVIEAHAELGPAHRLSQVGAADSTRATYESTHVRPKGTALTLRHAWFGLSDEFTNAPAKARTRARGIPWHTPDDKPGEADAM